MVVIERIFLCAVRGVNFFVKVHRSTPVFAVALGSNPKGIKTRTLNRSNLGIKPINLLPKSDEFNPLITTIQASVFGSKQVQIFHISLPFSISRRQIKILITEDCKGLISFRNHSMSASSLFVYPFLKTKRRKEMKEKGEQKRVKSDFETRRKVFPSKISISFPFLSSKNWKCNIFATWNYIFCLINNVLSF